MPYIFILSVRLSKESKGFPSLTVYFIKAQNTRPGQNNSLTQGKDLEPVYEAD